jgi:predicted histone-like DNA-binding protein
MSIKFKVIERGQPGVTGGGEKKFYASPVMSGELTLPGLTKAIEKICTVSGADIRAVLYALVDVSIDSLADGNIVRLGDLGSLRVSLSSEGKATADEVSANAVKGSSVIFTPGVRIKEMLSSVKYQKE